jgi:hypothetical protein
MSVKNQDALKASIENTLQNHIGHMITPDVRFDGFGAWRIAATPKVGFPTGLEKPLHFNVPALDGDDSREALEDVNGIEAAYNWLDGLGLITEDVYFEIV